MKTTQSFFVCGTICWNVRKKVCPTSHPTTFLPNFSYNIWHRCSMTIISDAGSHVANVDGQWSVWAAWTECDMPCGGGEQQRERACNDPLSSGSGKDCVGHGYEIRRCHEHSCQGGYGEDCNWFYLNEYFFIILETGDVQRHRALCEYGAIKMLYFIIIIIIL